MRVTRRHRAQARWALELLVTVMLGFTAAVMTAWVIRAQAWPTRAYAGGAATVAVLLCGALVRTRAQRWPDRGI